MCPLNRGKITAALDECALPKDLPHGLAECLASVENYEHTALCLHSAFAQIKQQFTARHGVFGGSFSHSQDVFVALLIDSYCDQKDMLCYMNSVEHQHTELEGIQPTLKELLDLRSGLFDEAATHRAVEGRD